MKAKFLTLAAAALALGFSSCKNENTSTEDNSVPKNVFMRMEQAYTAESRGDGTALPNGTTYAFTSGDLYFLTSSGVITKHFTLNSSPTNLAGGTINLTDLSTTGVNVLDIPGNSSTAYVIGNSPVTLATAGDFTSVKEAMIEAVTQSQIAAPYNVSKVTLYGGGGAFTGTTPNFAITLTPAPVAGRIEVSDMKLKTDSHIVSYKVQGIFVNNFYEKKELQGTVLAANLKNYGSVNANYLENSVGTLFTTANKGILFDAFAGGKASVSGLVAPTGVWAYNLLSANDVPHVIVHLTDIVCESPYSFSATDGYLTIGGFVDATTSVPVTEFKGGYVYRIKPGDFEFGLDDITLNPEIEKINCRVTVQLQTWTIQNVKPTL